VSSERRIDRGAAPDALAVLPDLAYTVKRHVMKPAFLIHQPRVWPDHLALAGKFHPRAAVPGLVGILEEKRQSRRRIKMIAGYRAGRKLGVADAGMLPMNRPSRLGLACCVFAL